MQMDRQNSGIGSSTNLAVAVKLATKRLLASSTKAKTFLVSAEIQRCLQRGPADTTQALVSHRRLVVVLAYKQISR